jgi:hypothetical protein
LRKKLFRSTLDRFFGQNTSLDLNFWGSLREMQSKTVQMDAPCQRMAGSG